MDDARVETINSGKRLFFLDNMRTFQVILLPYCINFTRGGRAFLRKICFAGNNSLYSRQFDRIFIPAD